MPNSVLALAISVGPSQQAPYRHRLFLFSINIICRTVFGKVMIWPVTGRQNNRAKRTSKHVARKINAKKEIKTIWSAGYKGQWEEEWG